MQEAKQMNFKHEGIRIGMVADTSALLLASLARDAVDYLPDPLLHIAPRLLTVRSWDSIPIMGDTFLLAFCRQNVMK